jgi:hypothetical protein
VKSIASGDCASGGVAVRSVVQVRSSQGYDGFVLIRWIIIAGVSWLLLPPAFALSISPGAGAGLRLVGLVLTITLGAWIVLGILLDHDWRRRRQEAEHRAIAREVVRQLSSKA